MIAMHALILAGGEGSRLRADGVPAPKAMVPVAGRPLLVGMVETLSGLGCPTITVAIRRDTLSGAALRDLLERSLRIVDCRTPSSLHTLEEGLWSVPPGPLLCTMVDTVMRPEDWKHVLVESEQRLREGADACVSITSFVHDESPLYVREHDDGSVARFASEPGASSWITGGAYVLSSRVRDLVPRVISLGIVRMRGFLQWLVEHGYRVATTRVEHVVDLDRLSDLRLAEAGLTGAQ